ncbi:MAG: nickel pincer cofactor biosynthesis protein LarB [Deltaproteobacteria bacterium]|nr:nickel pincer cofactor biosynthesis protein LarB [Deltaproteobacteria bacterium]
MNPERLRELLERVRGGDCDVDSALGELRRLPFVDIGVATLDHHRALRQGVPEVVFGEGKSAEQIALIVEELDRGGADVLVTRIGPDKAEVVRARCPDLRFNALGGVASLRRRTPPARTAPPVLVVCAGTSDLPVAEEAVETLTALGIASRRIVDVGVAGIHRLFARKAELDEASVIIAIAGMEGALPSVIGGLVACPVIAVPTSVGYGSTLGGLTAMLAMLTSCASGLTVVNVDNGFGAAMAVHRMIPRAG